MQPTPPSLGQEYRSARPPVRPPARPYAPVNPLARQSPIIPSPYLARTPPLPWPTARGMQQPQQVARPPPPRAAPPNYFDARSHSSNPAPPPHATPPPSSHYTAAVAASPVASPSPAHLATELRDDDEDEESEAGEEAPEEEVRMEGKVLYKDRSGEVILRFSALFQDILPDDEPYKFDWMREEPEKKEVDPEEEKFDVTREDREGEDELVQFCAEVEPPRPEETPSLTQELTAPLAWGNHTSGHALVDPQELNKLEADLKARQHAALFGLSATTEENCSQPVFESPNASPQPSPSPALTSTHPSSSPHSSPTTSLALTVPPSFENSPMLVDLESDFDDINDPPNGKEHSSKHVLGRALRYRKRLAYAVERRSFDPVLLDQWEQQIIWGDSKPCRLRVKGISPADRTPARLRRLFMELGHSEVRASVAINASLTELSELVDQSGPSSVSLFEHPPTAERPWVGYAVRTLTEKGASLMQQPQSKRRSELRCFVSYWNHEEAANALAQIAKKKGDKDPKWQHIEAEFIRSGSGVSRISRSTRIIDRSRDLRSNQILDALLSGDEEDDCGSEFEESETEHTAVIAAPAPTTPVHSSPKPALLLSPEAVSIMPSFEDDSEQPQGELMELDEEGGKPRLKCDFNHRAINPAFVRCSCIEHADSSINEPMELPVVPPIPELKPTDIRGNRNTLPPLQIIWNDKKKAPLSSEDYNNPKSRFVHGSAPYKLPDPVKLSAQLLKKNGEVGTTKTGKFGEFSKPPEAAAAAEVSVAVKPLNIRLARGSWLDTVVWDDEEAPREPPLTNLILEPNDEHMIFEDCNEDNSAEEVEEVEADGSGDNADRANDEKDPFLRLANDKAYRTQQGSRNIVGEISVRHSVPAMKLGYSEDDATVTNDAYPINFTPEQLNHWHRPILKPKDVKERMEFELFTPTEEDQTKKGDDGSAGAGPSLFGEARNTLGYVPKKLSEMSGKDQTLALFEYMEENPVLLNNVGMCSKLLTYYRKHSKQDNFTPTVDLGGVAVLGPNDETPFLGGLPAGKTVCAVNNNLYVAPAVRHQRPKTDFLLVKRETSDGRSVWYIREAPPVYAIGQLQPKIEVPAPASKSCSRMLRNRISVAVDRLLTGTEGRVNQKDLVVEFKDHHAIARKILKEVADYQRNGEERGCYSQKDSYLIASEEEIQARVTPEHAVALESMLAAQQRLTRMGFTWTAWSDKMTAILANLTVPELTKVARYIQYTLLCLPWSASKIWVLGAQGRAQQFLDARGNPFAADCGFAFIDPSGKRKKDLREEEEKQSGAQEKAVMGTDSDLRKLRMPEIERLLADVGVKEEDIPTERWDRVNLLRDKVNTAVASGTHPELAKYARILKMSGHEQHEAYKQQALSIFMHQLDYLKNEPSAKEVYEDPYGEEEEKAKKVAEEAAMQKKKKRMSEEEEEAELYRAFANRKAAAPAEEKARAPESAQIDPSRKKRTKKVQRKVLIITRKKMLPTGVPSVTQERITDPVRIAQAEKALRERGTAPSDQKKRENRTKHEQKRREEVRRKNFTSSQKRNPNITCGACGQKGHMKTHSLCPLYTPSRETEDREPSEPFSGRLSIPRSKLQQAPKPVEEVQPGDLKITLAMPPARPNPKAEKKAKEKALSMEYLQPQAKKHRITRRGDPKVTLGSIFEGIIQKAQDNPHYAEFRVELDRKKNSIYYSIIHEPVFLRTLRTNASNLKYNSSVEFLKDVRLIESNCALFNNTIDAAGVVVVHPLTKKAQQLVQDIEQQLNRESGIRELESEIQTLEHRKALNMEIKKTLENLWSQTSAVHFHFRPDCRYWPDYLTKIQQPVSLDDMMKKADRTAYHSAAGFLADLRLMVLNCERYNGDTNDLPQLAQALYNMAKNTMSELYGEEAASALPDDDEEPATPQPARMTTPRQPKASPAATATRKRPSTAATTSRKGKKGKASPSVPVPRATPRTTPRATPVATPVHTPRMADLDAKIDDFLQEKVVGSLDQEELPDGESDGEIDIAGDVFPAPTRGDDEEDDMAVHLFVTGGGRLLGDR